MSSEIAQKRGPVALIILDGWGLSPSTKGNAITLSNPPVMDRLWREYPHTVLHAFQPAEQTRRGQVGSSDIGHAMIGAGRHLKSDLEEIEQAIDEGLFETNPVLNNAVGVAHDKQVALHLIGLMSDGGVHSSLKTLAGLLRLARNQGLKQVFLHLITDGIDVAPMSSIQAAHEVESLCERLGIGTPATVIGRHYAMDRDHHWDRTLAAYKLWTSGEGAAAPNLHEALSEAHRRGLTDPYIPPVRIGKDQNAIIQDHDVVVVWNGRSDRLRQLSRAFVDNAALRHLLVRQAALRKLTKFVTLVSPQLPNHLPVEVAFPPARVPVSLGEILSGRGLTQLRAAESEKYPHVSYFFSGGREEPYPGEDRLIVPSPHVDHFDLTPAMSLEILVSKLIAKLEAEHYDFVLLNIANVDAVGHTGNLLATAEAIRHTDQALEKLTRCILGLNGIALITADHGNAEQMLTVERPDSHKRHTLNPVPFIFVSNDQQRDLIKQAVTAPPNLLADLVRSRHTLADVAPTILALFGLPVPIEMTGHSLLEELK